MSEKMVAELLEEQNELIRQQNKLLAQRNALANAESNRADINGAADRWDKANPIGRFFWQNPIKRR